MLHHQKLPPLHLLPTFELAARLKSFKKTAEAMGLTPSAVSQQIKALEEDLGVKLFIRHTRSIALSADGQRFLTAISPALMEIASATLALKRRPFSTGLRLSTVPFIAHEMLIPNMHTYPGDRSGHPLQVETSVHIETERLQRGDVHAALRMGQGNWHPFQAQKVGNIQISLVSSVEMAAKIESPRDLKSLPLIAVRGHEEASWRPLAERHGFSYAASDILIFETYFETLRAAEAGLGVTLGLYPLVKTWIRANRLATPISAIWNSPFDLYLVTRPQDQNRPEIIGLYRWISHLYEALIALPTRR